MDLDDVVSEVGEGLCAFYHVDEEWVLFGSGDEWGGGVPE